MSTTCDCTDARLETYETPSGHTITRCIDCGAQEITSEPAAVEAAEETEEAPQPIPDGATAVWTDVADLSIPKMIERLDDIEDDDERAAMTAALVAWEKGQHNPRKGVLDLEATDVDEGSVS